MHALIVLAGGPSRSRIDLTDTVTVVGTATAAYPWLTSVNGLARRHTTFSRGTDGSITVTDLDTRTGTHVNGARIRAPHQLRPNDQVRMGDLIVSPVTVAAPPPPSPQPQSSAPSRPAVPPPAPAVPSPDAVFQQAQALHRQGQIDPARHLLEAALATDPDHVPCRFALAVCLIDLGRKAEAVDHLRRVLELFPTHAVAAYQLGRCLADLGATAEAAAALRRALAIDPAHAAAQALLRTVEAPPAAAPVAVYGNPAAVSMPAPVAVGAPAPQRQAAPDPAEMARQGNPIIQVGRSLTADIDLHNTAYAGALIHKGNIKFRYLLLSLVVRVVVAAALTAAATRAPAQVQQFAVIALAVVWLWVLAGLITALVRSALNDFLFYERCMELRLGVLSRQTRTVWYHQMAPLTRTLTIANYLSYTASLDIQFEEAGSTKSVRLLAMGNLREVEQLRKELELHRVRERRQFKGITG
ncbi:tetratricopeptide repeat protein [Dactylosporangium sp. NPDC051541]|uniref:tetratricopeptide repeat protein n=1 Tax=Dactylosporangium sp. NPDC051541 TaxID=3363977 RepID=UPI0037AC0390